MKGWTCHYVKSQKQLAIAPLSHTHSTRHFEHGNTLSFVDSFVHHYSVEVDNDRVPIVLLEKKLENRSPVGLAPCEEQV
jgi:hypothetical protein